MGILMAVAQIVHVLRSSLLVLITQKYEMQKNSYSLVIMTEFPFLNKLHMLG